MESGTGVICPRCATENPANAKFCQRCWAFLRGRHCPHCGKQATRAGARYCEHCNEDLEVEPTTPRPRAGDHPAEPQVRSVDDSPVVLEARTVLNGPAISVVPPQEPLGHRAVAVHEAIDHEPIAPLLEAAPDDQPIPTLIELPEAPGLPMLPPAPGASRPVVQPPPQPAPLVTQSPVETAPVTPAVAPQPPRETKRPRSAPPRRSGSPVVTVGVVLLVVAVIGAMLALRRQREETPNQGAVPPAQRTAASPTQPAGAPSSSPAGAPTQAAPVGGTLKITTTPAGAQVELDWVQVGVTTTALTLADVRPGKHTIKVSKTGFQSQIREVQLASGETFALELTLTGSTSPSVPRRQPAAPPPLPPPP